MKEHLQRWGLEYVLITLFVLWWAVQFHAGAHIFTLEQAQHEQPFTWREYLPHFLKDTSENMQSEFFSNLILLGLLGSGLTRRFFRSQTEGQERLEKLLEEVRDAVQER